MFGTLKLEREILLKSVKEVSQRPRASVKTFMHIDELSSRNQSRLGIKERFTVNESHMQGPPVWKGCFTVSRLSFRRGNQVKIVSGDTNAKVKLRDRLSSRIKSPVGSCL